MKIFAINKVDILEQVRMLVKPVPVEVNVVHENSDNSKMAKKPPRGTTDPVLGNHTDSIPLCTELLSECSLNSRQAPPLDKVKVLSLSSTEKLIYI